LLYNYAPRYTAKVMSNVLRGAIPRISHHIKELLGLAEGPGGVGAKALAFKKRVCPKAKSAFDPVNEVT
jgi:hypothetical protein